MKLALVVPFYNEEKYLPDLLKSIDAQTDKAFDLVLVDNNSTDKSYEIADDYALHHRATAVITETQKGSGAASDTGFRYAIQNGAEYIARTDADSLLDTIYISALKKHILTNNIDLIVGYLHLRNDENPSFIERAVYKIYSCKHLLPIFELVQTPFRGKDKYLHGFMYLWGFNLAIKSTAYEKCGGFPRIGFEKKMDDAVLFDRVRKITNKIHRFDDIKVYMSLRRFRKLGVLNNLLWYAGFRGLSFIEDVR